MPSPSQILSHIWSSCFCSDILVWLTWIYGGKISAFQTTTTNYMNHFWKVPSKTMVSVKGWENPPHSWRDTASSVEGWGAGHKQEEQRNLAGWVIALNNVMIPGEQRRGIQTKALLPKCKIWDPVLPSDPCPCKSSTVLFLCFVCKYNRQLPTWLPKSHPGDAFPDICALNLISLSKINSG